MIHPEGPHVSTRTTIAEVPGAEEIPKLRPSPHIWIMYLACLRSSSHMPGVTCRPAGIPPSLSRRPETAPEGPRGPQRAQTTAGRVKMETLEAPLAHPGARTISACVRHQTWPNTSRAPGSPRTGGRISVLGHYPSWLSNGSPWPPPAAGISLGGQHEGGTRGYRKMGG